MNYESTSLERDALDHGIDRLARRQGKPLHRLYGEPRGQRGAAAIQLDLGLRATGSSLDRGDAAGQYVQRADLLGRLERQHDVAGTDVGAHRRADGSAQ